jgi:hypothetical protein
VHIHAHPVIPMTATTASAPEHDDTDEKGPTPTALPPPAAAAAAPPPPTSNTTTTTTNDKDDGDEDGEGDPLPLSPHDLEAYARDGFCRLPQAFPPHVAAACREQLWAVMAEQGGVEREKPETWPVKFPLAFVFEEGHGEVRWGWVGMGRGLGWLGGFGCLCMYVWMCV